MATITAGDFRNGKTFEMDGKIMQVVEFQHVKPGKGAAFVRTKMKNVVTGAVTETSFNPTAKFEEAFIERKDYEYSYNDGDLYYFMDQETYDMVPVSKDMLDDSFKFIKDGQESLHTPGDGKLESAVYAALGREFAKTLVPVQGRGGDIEVRGFVTAPVNGRGSRSMQVFFVNGRFIKSQLLTAALEARFGLSAASASILRTEFLTADKQKFQ